jgi:adenosylcobinamide-GDP ribazoletransferase
LKKTYNNHSSTQGGFRVILQEFLAAVLFYTVIPLPATWPTRFWGIARYAPLVGVLLGSTIAGLLSVVEGLGMPIFTSTALAVGTWVALTGGLHLDGAMDTADGLGVYDLGRRLEVMSDSRTGAFGVMAGVVILIVKVAAIADTSNLWIIPVVCGWGRWAQLAAIIRHPYAKPEGKGAFHKAQIRSPLSAVVNLLLLLALSIATLGYWGAWFGLTCGALGLFLGDYFDRALGGQTGDTYGAIVEWTETGALVIATLMF